ncbi:MAG: acyloxyacyl hydrolase [Candidatus Rokubacteria bacterium]|nr:acyloxyacyl hydrolase [Candidatus Rokubacteria bacterium]
MRTLVAVAVATAVGLAATAAPAHAFDAEQTFRKGAVVLSLEGGYHEQANIEGHRFQTGLEFWNAGARLSLLPFEPVGPGPLLGSLEVGLEPFYQRYVDPVDAFFAGLGAVARYHLLSFGRVVPYIEVMGAAGGTDLEVREIDSTFTFLVHGGAGFSVFPTDRTALYAGYRFQHVSNGNVDSPNRGFESHGGVFGVSVFFP